VLAEKIETIVSRNITNSRMRDYYDVYILTKLQGDNINFNLLKSAIQATTERRNTVGTIKNASHLMIDIRANDELQKLWKSYRADYEYAKDIEWHDVCETITDILIKTI
jgi:predicted nucleotidyltransferase component of viral defense system